MIFPRDKDPACSSAGGCKARKPTAQTQGATPDALHGWSNCATVPITGQRRGLRPRRSRAACANRALDQGAGRFASGVG
jgi:hypothetical protein